MAAVPAYYYCETVYDSDGDGVKSPQDMLSVLCSTDGSNFQAK